jgi:DNA (cytosine-5)-methyltransferase 1
LDGKEIRSRRRDAHLTQAELAARIGVATSTVARWEEGHASPRLIAQRALAAELGSPESETSAGARAITAVELFAGAGGLSLGFSQAGVQIRAATDIEPLSEETFRLNFPGVPFIRGDVRKLRGADLVAAAGVVPDLVIGGPPCQGFSTLGDKLSGDPRNLLFEEFARLVDEVRPLGVVIENVRALTTMYGGRFKDRVLGRFAEIGYRLDLDVLDAASFGVPQHRLRAFFVGFRANGAEYRFPLPTHGVAGQEFATVGAALSDLADKGDEVPNHIALNHSETVVRRYRLVPEGGRLPKPEALPPEIRRSNFGNTYKRLHRDRPSLTLVPGNNAFPIHPWLDRSLTPREAARLQTFPDDYTFPGDRRHQCILVGNAVPVRLARAVAETVASAVVGMQWPVQLELLPGASSPPRLAGPRDAIGVAKLGDRPASQGFVDLFSGAGGFIVGFARANLRPLAALDNDVDVVNTHEFNYPGVPIVTGDAAETSTLDALARLVPEPPFAVVGGPPCQGFSVFGKRRFTVTRGHDPRKDPRNQLVFAFVDAVGRLRPRWVVMENVAGFATLDGGSFLDRVIADLRTQGYKSVEWRVLNAAHYGVPQQRRRFVLIANRTGHVIPWPKKKFFAEPRDWQKPFRGVGEVLTDLAEPGAVERVSCHVAMNHKPLLVERYRYIPEGGRLQVDELPPHLRTGYRTKEVKNFSHVFRRLHRDQPSITLVPGHNAFPIHPWLDRALTVREAARIQTFPDEVEFTGSRQNQCIQVGNAFPPLVAQLIADNLVKAERNGWYPGHVPRSATYALVDLTERTDGREEPDEAVAV